jgi:hypothetical protein
MNNEERISGWEFDNGSVGVAYTRCFHSRRDTKNPLIKNLLTRAFRVGRTGLEPVTPCASCLFDVFGAVR